tara:strand:+ start:58 stop:237 length:180 start_codon:yes stop_codon:yes gene_type:complete
MTDYKKKYLKYKKKYNELKGGVELAILPQNTSLNYYKPTKLLDTKLKKKIIYIFYRSWR